VVHLSVTEKVEPLVATATPETKTPVVGNPDWDRPEPKGEAAKELHATIVAVKKLSLGQYVLTFDDGQVWREIETRRRSRYKIGDQIVITRVFGGSFDLKSKTTGYHNKVRRLE